MDTIREKIKKYLNQDFHKIYKINKIICYWKPTIFKKYKI